MTHAADFCWVGADGALHSGDAGDLMHAFLAGALPARHPVWRQGWSEWMLLVDAIADRRLEVADAPTERDPDTLPASGPTLVDVVAPSLPDPDSTFEDVTQPLPRFSLAPPTLRSGLPPPAESLPPTGMALTLPPPARAPARRLRTPVLLGVGLALAGGVASLFILWSATGEQANVALKRGTPRPPALVATAAPAAATIESCSAQGTSVDVSERVAPGTTLHLSGAGAGRVAVGVTSTEKSGLGLVLALDPLAVEARSVLADPVHVAGVVPDGSKFSTDRWTRRVHAEGSFSLGMTPSGFSRIADDGSQATLWPGQSSAVISRPVVESAGPAGLAVAFRRGADGAATIRVGWLSPRGERSSELGTLSVASGTVDTPTLAVNGGRMVVAYAARQPLESPWGIELGAARTGELPVATQRFSGGDPRKDQQRPALSPLPGGRWLLAWAEGDRASGRRIRAQLLDASLAPLGATLDVARPTSWVGALGVHTEAAEGLVLFTERAHRQSEVLRAVRVLCR